AGAGQFIVALKGTGFAGHFSLMMFHRSGGRGIELLQGEIRRNPFRPTTSADGRLVYYDRYYDVNTGGEPWGREDALQGRIQTHQLDLKTGLVQPITAGESA